MNRDTFRSAYDKLALTDECKSEMKAKLLANMDQQRGGDFYDVGDCHRAREIKITRRKRGPLKTALFAGSAAAAAAGLAVGAGFWLNRNPAELQHNLTPPLEARTAETQTVEANAEKEYFTKRYASGTMTFQEFTVSTRAHSQPEEAVPKDEQADYISREILERYLLGMDEEFDKWINGLREDNEKAGCEAHDIEQVIAGRPLGDELWLSDVLCSGSGTAFTYLSKDGTKQVNISVSDDPDEFLPITLPDGGYLVPAGEYQSSFVVCDYTEHGYYQFVDPETFDLAAGSEEIGGDEYFAAVFAFDCADRGMKYYRLDGKNITREQFIGCVGKAAAVNLHDHYGYYSDDGMNKLPPEREQWNSDCPVIPEAAVEETMWGEIRVNVIANKYPWVNSSYHFNVEYTDSNIIPEEYRYSIKDITEYSGIDLEKALPEDFEKREVSYFARYDGMSFNNSEYGWGANKEMLPGDDREQFDISRDYIVNDYEALSGEEECSYYTTDKIEYFSGKTRTGALYSVECRSDGESGLIKVDVFDDWEMFSRETRALFGRLPAEKTVGFAGVEDKSLYVGGNVLNGNEYYIGGFMTGDGKYVVLQAENTGLDGFAEVLAKLFTNNFEAVPQ